LFGVDLVVGVAELFHRLSERSLVVLACRRPEALCLCLNVLVLPARDRRRIPEWLKIGVTAEEVALQLNDDKPTSLVECKEIDSILALVQLDLAADEEQRFAEHRWRGNYPVLEVLFVQRLIWNGRGLYGVDLTVSHPVEHARSMSENRPGSTGEGRRWEGW